MYRLARPIGVTVLALGLNALYSGPLLAQTAPGAQATGGLEEVVVTATRREERLQDVPISVTAFSQEKMDAQAVRSIDDLTRLTPGVAFSRNGMGSSANYNDENSDINIRGIDSQAGTSTTGIYIDDTPVQSRHIGFGAVNVFPALFDLDRVEVLRGPQGTLFGAGAEGGVVRFIAPEPGLTQNSGYLRSELATTRHGDPSYELGAAAGGPIAENLFGYRVSASYRRDGGYVDRVGYTLVPDPTDVLTPTPVYNNTVVQKNSNWQETITLRAALKWALNDKLSISPSIYYQRLQINDTAAYWEALSDPSAGIFRNGNALPNTSTDPFWLAAVKLDWDVGFARLISNTSYYERDQHSTSEYTQYLRATYTYFAQLPNTFPQPGDKGYAPFGDKQHNFYQEVRLASSDAAARVIWNTGIFYSHLNENIPENIIDPTLNAEAIAFSGVGVCSAALPCPGGLIYYGPEDRVIDKQIAAFGEVTYRFTDTIKATVGLRVSHVAFTGTVFQGGPFLGTPNAGTSSSASENPVTPKVVLDYQPNRDNLFYASASKGYRPGGVNIGVGDICGADLLTLGLPIGPDGLRHAPGQYSSDSLWSYELGAKNTLLDHRLQINSAVYVIDWKNIVQNVYLPSCGEQFSANLGQARSKGGELEIQFRPIEPFLLGVSLAYVDAKFTKGSCAGSLTFDSSVGKCIGSSAPLGAKPIAHDGNALLGAPWTILASAEYSFSAMRDKAPYIRVDYQYTTAQTALLPTQDNSDALHDITIPGLPVTRNLQLRAGVRWSGFDLSVFGTNLTDSHPLLFRSRDIANDSPFTAVNPTDKLYFARSVRSRTIGITATYRY